MLTFGPNHDDEVPESLERTETEALDTVAAGIGLQTGVVKDTQPSVTAPMAPHQQLSETLDLQPGPLRLRGGCCCCITMPLVSSTGAH